MSNICFYCYRERLCFIEDGKAFCYGCSEKMSEKIMEANKGRKPGYLCYVNFEHGCFADQ